MLYEVRRFVFRSPSQEELEARETRRQMDAEFIRREEGRQERREEREELEHEKRVEAKRTQYQLELSLYENPDGKRVYTGVLDNDGVKERIKTLKSFTKNPMVFRKLGPPLDID